MEGNFSPQESLQLIQSMINKTKGNMGKNRFYFLFWGWYVFVAILAQFILKVVLRYEHHYLVWWGVLPAVIITIVYSSKQNKLRGVRTYIDESMNSLWTGIGISFFVLSLIIGASKQGWLYSYPFFILFYGLGTFISGRILKFTPLVVGGIINWVLAGVAPFVAYDYQMLLASAAILTSYIIPGHLLGNKRTEHGRKTNL
jgi:hypothetical protein